MSFVNSDRAGRTAPLLRTRVWCARLLVFFAAVLVLSGGVRAGDVEFGDFRPFTVHSRDKDPLKDDVIVVFHGFRSAMPNGAYKRLHKALSDDFSVIGFNYEYFDIEANEAAMDNVWNSLLKDRNVTFIGTSLGGFWANHFAEKYGVEREVLINPVVDPVEQLQQFVGRHVVEKRGIEIDVTEADIERYAPINDAPEVGPSRLVLLSRDDAILDFRLAEEAFTGPGNTVVLFDEGGHTLNLRESRFMDVIRDYLLPTS